LDLLNTEVSVRCRKADIAGGSEIQSSTKASALNRRDAGKACFYQRIKDFVHLEQHKPQIRPRATDLSVSRLRYKGREQGNIDA